MAEKLNAGHAKNRALVAFPGQTPGSTMTGRLLCIGGRNRGADIARITLASGRIVTRKVDQVRLLPEAPRVPRVLGVSRQDLPEHGGSYVGDRRPIAPRSIP